jgi:Fur family ferric uptake transcriptional regulator
VKRAVTRPASGPPPSAAEHIATLRRAGLRATPARIKLLEFFYSSERQHLTGDQVHELLRERRIVMGIATVYRAMNQLVEAGILVRSFFHGGSAVYERNPAESHDHIVCLSCARVDEFADQGFELVKRSAAEALGYALAPRQVVLHGHCRECRKKQRSDGPG